MNISQTTYTGQYIVPYRRADGLDLDAYTARSILKRGNLFKPQDFLSPQKLSVPISSREWNKSVLTWLAWAHMDQYSFRSFRSFARIGEIFKTKGFDWSRNESEITEAQKNRVSLVTEVAYGFKFRAEQSTTLMADLFFDDPNGGVDMMLTHMENPQVLFGICARILRVRREPIRPGNYRYKNEILCRASIEELVGNHYPTRNYMLRDPQPQTTLFELLVTAQDREIMKRMSRRKTLPEPAKEDVRAAIQYSRITS